MGVLSKIYRYCPAFVQNMGVSAYGLYWKRRRFGGVFSRELAGYSERESWTTTQWTDYQTIELRKILLHAFETVPFYAASFSRRGFNASKLKALELSEFKQIPVLEKDDLRRFGTSTMLSSKPESGGRFYSSSGSTGSPTKILFSTAMHQRWSAAFEARVRNWAGVDRTLPRGMIGGRRVIPDGNSKGPFYRFNHAEKQVYFSAYHLSPTSASDYVNGIRKHSVNYMTGYAVSNYLLAKFIRDQGLPAPRLRAVLTSSEKLTGEMRQTMESVYGCGVYDGYSGVEACGLITESDQRQLLDSPDVGFTEVVDAERNDVAPGETGEILSTGFLNFDQPLIRYRIGDRVRLSENQKPQCGRSMKVIDEIEGRLEDIVTGPDGRQMVRFHGVFVDLKDVLQGQVEQFAEDEITVRLVPTSAESEETTNTVKERIISQLGPLNVTIEYLDRIEPGANGKTRAVISHVKN